MAQQASPAYMLWRTELQKYRDFLNRVIIGMLRADPKQFSTHVIKNFKQPHFKRFCTELHMSLYDALKKWTQGTDSDLLLIDLFSETALTTDHRLQAGHAFQLFTRYYLRYLSAVTLSTEPFKVNETEFQQIHQSIANLPTTYRVIERKAFEGAVASIASDSAMIYKTKFKTFNYFLGGGLRDRRLYTIGGAPGVGKSGILLNFFLDAAKNSVPVVYISLENSVEETQRREIAHILRHSLERLYFEIQGVEQKVLAGLHENRELIETINTFGTIMEMNSITVDEIRNVLSEKKPKILCLDYLNLVNHTVYGNKAQDLEDLTTTLARLAKEFNVAIITPCQLNRNAISAVDPDETAVGESWGIVKASDMFITFYRMKSLQTEDEKDPVLAGVPPEKRMVFAIVKSRFTRLGKIPIVAEKECICFEEL